MASSTRAAAPNLRTCYDRFAQHFGSAEDYRRQESVHHRLIDILFITLCASIAGADDLSAVAEFAKTNEPWFSPQLDLGQGVPSESTFRTVFMLLDGEELVKYFVPWVQELTDTTTQIPQAWRFKVEGHELWTLADIERVKC